MKRLGGRIKKARDSARLTQEAVAGRAKMAARTLQRLEDGVGNPTIETLDALSIALGVSLVWLVAEPKTNKEANSFIEDLKIELEHMKLDDVENLKAGLELLDDFVGLSRDLQTLIVSLAKQDAACLSGLSREFYARIPRKFREQFALRILQPEEAS